MIEARVRQAGLLALLSASCAAPIRTAGLLAHLVSCAAPIRTVGLLALLLASCAVPIRTALSPSELLDRVWEAELGRDARSPAIPRALGHQQRHLRIEALKALARAQAAGTSSGAKALLGDRDEEVATWAAFALGQIGDPDGEAALTAALSGVSPVPDQVLLALGRSGTATTARVIAERLSDPNAAVRGASLLALGLLAKRLGDRFPRELYAKRIEPHVRDADVGVRYGAAYALMRMPGPAAAVALIPALGDSDPEIRANAARGLGAAHAAPNVLDPVISDPDWRVRVEVAKSLGTLGAEVEEDAPAAASRLHAMIDREFARLERDDLTAARTMHVLFAIVEAAGRLGPHGSRVAAALEQAPWGAANLRASLGPDLARLSCAVAHLLDRREGVVRRVRSCGDPGVGEWRRLEYVTKLLAHDGSETAIQALVNLTGHQDPRVRAAAVSALGDVEQPQSAAALVPLLESNDPYVASAAAEILSRPAFARFRPAGVVEKLGVVIDALVAQPDASLIVGALDAAGALGKDGRPLVPRLAALADDPRSAVRRRSSAALAAVAGTPGAYATSARALPRPLPDPIRDRVRLAVRTQRGDVEIELFGDVAPHAVGSVVDLASRGFYRDLAFHRVVPNFVAQGGCPRGDGWGGPGYTLPEETSPIPFVRGAVGIATNGPDTGGSQFFVMHSRHPHLEGAYSVIGRVTAGIEVVDALQPDDRIIDVEVRGRIR
jgi:cyclophilin family peptidyl-prolyl cis-trans isomerase/HEAT repeat protein